MVDAAPFEEHLSGLDIQLLDDALPRYAILGAADRGEVFRYRVVDRDQRCVLRAYEELVVVPVVAVGGSETGYLTVGGIEDHVLARCLPPRQDVSALVGLRLEVHRAPVRAAQGMEPHNLPAIVDDHRAALPCAAFFRGDEDVAGGDVIARLCGDLDGGWVEVRA